MEFKLRQGPWRTVFRGTFQGHQFELLRNGEELLLAAVYEKEAGATTGVLLQVFAVFSAVGEVQGFTESLGREAVVMSRHDGKNTLHFLAAMSKPEYSKMDEENVTAAVDGLIGNVRQQGGMLRDVAKAYELRLTPLGECSEAVRQAFFSQPLAVPLLHGAGEEPEAEAAAVPGGLGTVVLGVTKDEKRVEEPLQLLQRTVVEGETMQALHFVHLLVEGALLSNVSAIIFDANNYFEGLRHPNKSTGELQRYGVGIEPVGFPVKSFNAAEHLQVDLNSVSSEGLLQAFGCGSGVSRLVKSGLGRGKVKGLGQLIESIGKAGGEDSNSFEVGRAKRAVKLLGLIYPGLFSGSNRLEEVVKGWFRGIGRASIIKAAELDERALALLVNGFLNELLAFSRKRGEGKGLRNLVVLPRAERIFPKKPDLLSRNSVNALRQLQGYGVGFAVTAEKAIDLDRGLLALAAARVGIVKENDAAVQLQGKKNYRVLLRPGLSECSEMQ